MRYSILILLVVLASLAPAPDWSLGVSPHDVAAGDPGVVEIAVAPGASSLETIDLTFGAGLLVEAVEASSGAYAGGTWAFTRTTTIPASLRLHVRVLPSAQTNDAVQVRASWRDQRLRGGFALFTQLPRAIFLPVIQRGRDAAQ